MKHNSSIFVLTVLLSACSPKQKVASVKVELAPVELTVTTIGSGTVYAEEQAVLGFGAIGRVGEVLVSAGSKVKRGQKLASLENADLRAAAQAAQSEFSRVKGLFAERLVSQAALEDGRRMTEVAQAAYDRSLIVAPFDGLITEVNLRKGEISQVQTAADKPPLRIIDLKERLVKGEIDELDLGKIKIGLPARIKVPAIGNQKFAARVTSVVPFVSSTREQDRTSRIELKLNENDPSIPVGASAEVEILVESKANALSVPARAVLGLSKQRFVFKVVDGRLLKTDVKVGMGNYDRREITEGLAIGDEVVLPAENFEMKDGDRVEVMQSAEVRPNSTPSPAVAR